MTRLLFITAFLLGAIAVLWMGSSFIGSNVLALSVTAVIGFVYLIGIAELIKFRLATASLNNALEELDDQPPSNQVALGNWLDQLDPSLQNATRLRIEGDRVGLPAPVFTPYLVGLLVMLGLLGTFVGMVDTLQGAVVALEGTTELEAIRSGLAAPIKGLGLAFGTSVAGVAASAMLGLISTLSRRERMLATRALDRRINTTFREFSLNHNRQETYRALQQQAQALPGVADKLGELAQKLEQMGDKLGDKLLANQEEFHAGVERSYSALAGSVEQSLQTSLAESGRQAGESIAPIVSGAMAGVEAAARDSQQQFADTSRDQLQELTRQLSDKLREITDSAQAGLAGQERANETLRTTMDASFEAFSSRLEQAGTTILDNFSTASGGWLEQQGNADQGRLDRWTETLDQAQQQLSHQLQDTARAMGEELNQVAAAQQTSLQASAQGFEALSLALSEQWRQAGEQALAQQNEVLESLSGAAEELNAGTRASSAGIVQEIGALLQSSEELVRARVASEESWLDSHSQRMNELTAATREELSTLRADEERREQAAIERMAGLEATVAEHLAGLGKELEQPMSRLIETASETPRAAAEVIGKLREEISNNIERDNTLLEERRLIMEQLNSLASSLEQSSAGQREAVESLVAASAGILQEAGSRFGDQVGVEVDNMGDIAAHFAGSATELSSLGEAFTHAVSLFNDSNEKLIDNLGRIEDSMEQAHSRSDEQMGYYVAQAREVIDQSTLSQRELIEELRQLGRQEELFSAEAS